MIRLLLGSTLPILGLCLAAAIVAPNLIAAPRGEPIIMASADASLQAASYDGDGCAPTLLFAAPLDERSSGARVIAFALRTGERGVAVEIEDFPGAMQKPKTVVLVFDDAGRVVSIGDSTSLHAQVRGKAAADCLADGETQAPI